VRTDAQFIAHHDKVIAKLLQNVARDVTFPLNAKHLQKALKDKGKLTTTSALKKAKSTAKGNEVDEGADEHIDSQKLLLDMQKVCATLKILQDIDLFFLPRVRG